MKAEIGFVWDDPDRLWLVVTAETRTEGATLRIFKRRMGLYDSISDGMHGQLIIEEPAKPDAALIDAAFAEIDKHQLHGAQVPDIDEPPQET